MSKSQKKKLKSLLEKQVENEYKFFLKKICSELGTGITNTKQLMNKGRDLFGDLFRGVYPSDMIPSLISGQCLIFNLDKRNQPGTHWCAMYKHGRSVYYYDSFGRKVLKGAGALSSDKDVEQKMTENNCGQRCLAWLICVYLLGIDKALLI